MSSAGTSEMDSVNAMKLKEAGNKCFKTGNYSGAILSYSQALKEYNANGVDPVEAKVKEEMAVLYKNRAASHLKLKSYQEALDDATKSLKLAPNDPKALFRRCQAHEHLGNLEDAFQDVKKVYELDPKNTAVQEVLRRLSVTLQNKINKTRTTEGMIKEMVETILNVKGSATSEQRAQALKNLVIYAHQTGGSEIMQELRVLELIKSNLLKGSEDDIVHFFKMVHGICERGLKDTLEMLNLLSVNELGHLLITHTNRTQVVTNLLSVIVQIITSMVNNGKSLHPITLEEEEKWTPREENLEAIMKVLEGTEHYKEIMLLLIHNLTEAKLSAEARDAVIDALIKLCALHRAVAYFVSKYYGVKRMVEVAAASGSVRVKDQNCLSVTENTGAHVSVCLATIFSLVSHNDKERKRLSEQGSDVILALLNCNDASSNVQGLAALTTLLHGARDIAEDFVNLQGVLEKALELALSNEPLTELLAGETIAYAASIKSVCTKLRNEAMDILKKLYKSPDPRIQVRGLVCLCKVGMTGSGNINDKFISEDGVQKLYKACRKFLTGTKKEFDLRKWAAEGLAYLTMNADIKEALVIDGVALNALNDLAKSEDSTVLYGVCNTLVNVTNTFDKKERNKEMEEIAKFAKTPVPELSEKDDPEYVKERINKLVKNGVVTALVSLAKTDSENSREMIARIFHGIVENPEHRGLVVQQGGAKALIPLALKGTLTGVDLAAQAIAKIGITTNPVLAFPGQRCMEVVRPLVKLLGLNTTGLQQFESLMALTNLAQVSDEVRKRIVKEKGVQAIENLMFEEHEMIRRAATECMCNMVICEDVFDQYLQDCTTPERVKLLVLFAGEEDPLLQRAATGALAILSSHEKICKKITEVKSWKEIFKQLLVCENQELQHRATYVVANMIENDGDIAKDLMEGDFFEILMALSLYEGPEKQAIKEHANRALAKAKKLGLIMEAK